MAELIIRAEDLRAAPECVRDWVAKQFGIIAATGAVPDVPVGSLADLTAQEAAQLLELLHNDYLACQVLFELGREGAPVTSETSGVRRLPLTEMLRHARMSSIDHLALCLDHITSMFRRLRPQSTQALFTIDEAGGLYVTESTSRAVHALWQAVVTARLAQSEALPRIDRLPHGPAVPLPATPVS